MKSKKHKIKEKNLAYIDGQNLRLGTLSAKKPWKVNLGRFRIFLKDKYKVETAYYYLGYMIKKNQDLYEKIQKAGFVLVFREHNTAMIGKKKGNVDCDIVFSVMKKMFEKKKFDKIILVSGDGDYKMMVDFLVEQKRFKKVLFPNKQFASSLYKKLGTEFFDHLENKHIKKKIKQ